MIPIENLKTFLFFSFKINQLSKIASLFFSFEYDKNFLSVHFLKCLLIQDLVSTFRFGGFFLRPSKNQKLIKIAATKE
jgi:hypothetical protein